MGCTYIQVAGEFFGDGETTDIPKRPGPIDTGYFVKINKIIKKAMQTFLK